MLSVIGKVNRKLQERLLTDSDAPYTTLNFTSVSSSAPSVFPTLSVVSLGEPSTGEDLQGTVQVGIWSTVELRAYTSTTLNDANTLLNRAGDVMLSMGYQLTYGIEALSETKPYCKVARFRRLWGSGDKR